MLRAFFGRHKSASTWARSVLHEVAAALDLEVLTIHVPAQWSAYPSLGDMIRAEKPDILVMTNATKAEVDTLPEMRAFHVVRDPRDIVVSGYFSHLHSHPEVVGGIEWKALPEHRRALKELDHDAGLMAEIAFSAQFFDNMSVWDYDRPDILEVRMEDLISDPNRGWSEILTHLDLHTAEPTWDEWLRTAAFRWNLAARRGTPRVLAYPRRVLPRLPLRRLPSSYLPTALARFSFERMSKGRKPGEEDVTSHYRRGEAGDWRNHLNSEHLKALKERTDDLVTRLGYH